MSWWAWSAAGIGAFLLFGRRAESAPAVDTSSPEGFTQSVGEAVGAVAPYLGVASRQIVVAHAAFESGWGRSTPARLGYNLFNVTRTKGDPRPVVESGDHECDAAGVCMPIVQRFAKYGSLGEGLADYFRVLSGSRYVAALRALEAGDPAEFVRRLREGGYFTLPLAEYQVRFAGVLAGVRKRWV